MKVISQRHLVDGDISYAPGQEVPLKAFTREQFLRMEASGMVTIVLDEGEVATEVDDDLFRDDTSATRVAADLNTLRAEIGKLASSASNPDADADRAKYLEEQRALQAERIASGDLGPGSIAAHHAAVQEANTVQQLHDDVTQGRKPATLAPDVDPSKVGPTLPPKAPVATGADKAAGHHATQQPPPTPVVAPRPSTDAGPITTAEGLEKNPSTPPHTSTSPATVAPRPTTEESRNPQTAAGGVAKVGGTPPATEGEIARKAEDERFDRSK